MTTDRTGGGTNQIFSKAFFNALVGALSEASGSPWLIAAMPDAQLTPDGAEPVRMKLTLAGSLRGEVLLECDRAAAATLVSKFLRQHVDEFGEDESKALLRLIEAGISEFRAALAPEYGKLKITVSSASEPAPDQAIVERIIIADDGANRASILMYLNPLLTEALSLHSEDCEPAAGTERPVQDAQGEAITEQVNLNLVMDVELNVTLRFGQRQLTLREVLELTTGSVIELDRQVEEPVELLLEGKVIARGEAVVIDGNYGLRVTEVLQPIFSPAVR